MFEQRKVVDDNLKTEIVELGVANVQRLQTSQIGQSNDDAGLEGRCEQRERSENEVGGGGGKEGRRGQKQNRNKKRTRNESKKVATEREREKKDECRINATKSFFLLLLTSFLSNNEQWLTLRKVRLVSVH